MKSFSLDYQGIHDYQKNRYPYLLIDYVSQVIPGESAMGYKNLTANDWFFKCHFEGDPSMPGMLQTEAMIQMAALGILTLDGFKGKIAYLVRADKLRYARQVRPGDRLDIETKIDSFKRGVAKASGKGYVGKELACSGEFTLAIADELEKYKVGGSHESI